MQVRDSGGRFTPDCQAIDREGRAPFVARFVGFFALGGVLIANALDPAWIRALDWPIPDAARWVGFASCLAGVALAGWTQVTVGCQWSAQLQLTEGHKLITREPHSWIRRPICAALVSLSIGFGLVTAKRLFISSGALSIGVALSRIPRNERMMLERVPGYAGYTAKVPFRLLPGIS